MATGHTRYPVVGAPDDLLGVIHLHDLLAPTRLEPPTRGAARGTVPTTLPLPQVLKQLHDTAKRWPWSSTSTAVSPESSPSKTSPRNWSVRSPTSTTPPHPTRPTRRLELPGELHLDEAERILGHRLPDGDYETLAGLVIADSVACPPWETP